MSTVRCGWLALAGYRRPFAGDPWVAPIARHRIMPARLVPGCTRHDERVVLMLVLQGSGSGVCCSRER